MSVHQSRHLRELRIEALKLQQEHLRFVRGRHMTWISDSDDIKIIHLHQDMIDLIGEVLDKYDRLLETLQKQEIGE